MFKQLRQFSIRMIAGANIATIIILFLIGFQIIFIRKDLPCCLMLVCFSLFFSLST